MFLSELLEVDLSGTEVFNALIDKDNSFFINVIRLKKAIVSEFRNAYERLNPCSNDIYYNRLGMEFGFKGIGYHNKTAESLSGEGVGLLKQGKIQQDAIIPIVFNMIILA